MRQLPCIRVGDGLRLAVRIVEVSSVLLAATRFVVAFPLMEFLLLVWGGGLLVIGLMVAVQWSVFAILNFAGLLPAVEWHETPSGDEA